MITFLRLLGIEEIWKAQSIFPYKIAIVSKGTKIYDTGNVLEIWCNFLVFCYSSDAFTKSENILWAKTCWKQTIPQCPNVWIQNVANEEHNKWPRSKVNDENWNLFHAVLRHYNNKFFVYKIHKSLCTCLNRCFATQNILQCKYFDISGQTCLDIPLHYMKHI